MRPRLIIRHEPEAELGGFRLELGKIAFDGPSRLALTPSLSLADYRLPTTASDVALPRNSPATLPVPGSESVPSQAQDKL